MESTRSYLQMVKRHRCLDVLKSKGRYCVTGVSVGSTVTPLTVISHFYPAPNAHGAKIIQTDCNLGCTPKSQPNICFSSSSSILCSQGD